MASAWYLSRVCVCVCVTSLVCCLQDEINSLRADQKAVLSVCVRV